MSGESSRRGFLRDATLAGAALVAGAGALSVTGCCKDDLAQLNAEVKRLKEENKQLADQRVVDFGGRVIIDKEGNLIIQGKELQDELCRIWNQQLQEGKTDPAANTLGVHVQFGESCVWRIPGRDPETGKVNSLCKC